MGLKKYLQDVEKEISWPEKIIICYIIFFIIWFFVLWVPKFIEAAVGK